MLMHYLKVVTTLLYLNKLLCTVRGMNVSWPWFVGEEWAVYFTEAWEAGLGSAIIYFQADLYWGLNKDRISTPHAFPSAAY